MNRTDDTIFAASSWQPLGAGMRKSLAELRSARSRRERRQFIVEGTKAVMELLPLFQCRLVVASLTWLQHHGDEVAGIPVLSAKRADFERLSVMSNPPDVIALFDMPERGLDIAGLSGKLTVALDAVQDPGNLGTIIRACDWFGVTDLLCSVNTADCYNPKVIQSTMGAIGRVAVHYVDLPQVLEELGDVAVYGTFLDGDDIYGSPLEESGVIVMGNEGHGISAEVARLVTRRLYIPPYPVDARHVESLNVSMATSIALAEFRRPRLNRDLSPKALKR